MVNEQQLHILSESLAQFRKFGFKSVTMDDISRNLGISKKTLYENFTDKDALVLETVKYMLAKNQQDIDVIFKSNKNAIEQLLEILSVIENMLKGLNLICFHDLQRYYPIAFKYMQQFKDEQMIVSIIDNLKKGIAEGYYRKDIRVDIISKLRMETAMWVFQDNVFPQDEFNPVEVNVELFAHYMYGIVSLKGYKLIERMQNKSNNIDCIINKFFKKQ